MKRKLLPAIVLGLVLLSAGAALADGDIYVGGPWGTRIKSLPFTINAPGAYYLGGNLSYSGSGNAITVDAGLNHVTLDLMGFTITGTGSGKGIFMNGSKNVEIRNGTVTAFLFGIHESGGSAKGHRILNVRAVGNTKYGIWLENTGHMVKGCEVDSGAHGYGIYIYLAGAVSGCTVRPGSGGQGIITWGGLISGNTVIGAGAFRGIAALMQGTVVRGNAVSGCISGIGATDGVSMVGNTVDAASGTMGISLSDVHSVLLDQNTITGASTTPYYPALPFLNVQTRTNYPY
jgi:hypothetical protein